MWVVVKVKVPFLGTLNNKCRAIFGTQKRTIILTTTHVIRVQLVNTLHVDTGLEEQSYRICETTNGILIWEFPKIRGTLFWGPYNKDPTI